MNNIPRYWRPLREIGTKDFHPERAEVVAETARFYKISEQEARAMLRAEHERARYFINDLYQIMVEEEEGGITHLNIRRLDGSMFKDWRHFQQIKNEICGDEREGIELYPAESRKVDTSNKWLYWCCQLRRSRDRVCKRGTLRKLKDMGLRPSSTHFDQYPDRDGL